MSAAPWFQREEFLARVGRVQAAMRARGLDAVLAFQPESVTWLTGFFTRGYSTFQFALVPATGEPAIFCRDVAQYYLDRTCVFRDTQVWADGTDRNAAAAEFLRKRLGAAARIGVELGAWQLNAARWEALKSALQGFGLEDCGELIQAMRYVKSPAEIAYQRQAAAAAQAGMDAGRAAAGAGVRERDVAAAVSAAMMRAGSDLPGPGPLSSGERARHLHGGFSDRVLEHGDTLQLECTPAVRYYHARFMRTIKIGAADDDDRRRAETLIAIQDAALREVRPGVRAAIPDRIYREGIINAGYAQRYTNKTFYSIGLMLPPTGGEALEATPECTWVFEPGMVFHTYLLADGFGFSETIAVTTGGCERLTRYPRELFVA